jgi:predicted Ser/Thr protein kinase
MHGGIEIPGVELLDELGRGAHGAVYRGRRGTDYYAVKVALAPSDPSAFVRFQREAIALARAKHPGLPRVLDVAKSGAPYLVMELVEGETLAARIARGTLSEEDTRALGLQLADVLAHIHRLGLVHRDVKPRNIIFDEKSGRARIVDFGIAIGTASNNFAAPEGTVPYAAPEQLRGLSIDGRADLYSLGCVLYECLCGQPPLGPLSLSRLGKADPLSDEAKLERSGVSAEFVRVIVRLVSQDAKGRFADAQAVIEELRSSRAELACEPARGAAFFRSGSGALVGRERELAALRKTWSEATGGSQRALAIEGPMGSGKTALLHTFCDQVRTEGYGAVYVSCAFYEPAPFGVARRVFDAFLAQMGEQRFREAAAGFEALLPAISPSLRRVFPDAPAVPDSDDAHHVILESAFKCLQRLLELDEATALCVDDCQWIDAGSASILRKLLGAGLANTLIVVAHRAEKVRSAEIDSLLGNGAEGLTALELGTLDEGSVCAIIANYLGSDAVPDEVVTRVAALSAPTPLGILEAVRTLLEERAILPDWQGWRLQAQVAEGVSLPDSVIETLRARITGLEPLVPEVLVAAAVVGMDFELAVLPEITGRTYDEASHAMREACRAALITGGALCYRFVHQAVRDALLAACTDSKLRDLSGRAAEVLDRKLVDGSEVQDPELIYRVADLYWRGEWRYMPERAIEVIESAAHRAFEAYDNRQALLLIERAAEIRHVISSAPGEQTLYVHGEVLIRLGNLAAGRELLGKALALSSDPLHRAEVLCRIAWSHEGQLDSTQAWSALQRAFAELGVEPPSASAGSFVRSGGAWLRHALGRVPTLTGDDKTPRRRQKILCALYYRAFRVGMLGTNLPLTIQAALLGLEAAQSLGVSASLSRAYLAYSFLLTAMGQNAKGRHYLSRGEDVARVTGNPVAIAHAIQLHTTIACWDGRMSEALEAGSKCLLEHGHWQDFSEHCQLAYNQQLLECVRGRAFEELVWVEHVLRQVELNAEASNVLEFIELGARALLVHLGRSVEADQMLRRLREVTVKIPKASAYYVLSFGPRVRALTDAADFGPALDTLDAEFRQGNHDPARVHLAVAEYYVHLAHARVHACLRALDRERALRVKELERAAKDLRAAARVPMLRAHSLVVDAYLALFTGDDERSSKFFAEADALAIEEESPWVRYAVARGRAHRCRERKNLEVARSEARRAEQIAQENGSVHRLRWIREEFGLSQTSSAIPLPSQAPSTDVRRLASPTSSAADARELRRWRARTRLARLEESAAGLEEGCDALLAELLAGLAAREVHLFSLHPSAGVHWVTGLRSTGQTAGPSEVDTFVRGVAAQKAGALLDDTEAFRSRLAVPLVERGEVELIVYAEAPGCGNFDREDCDLVSQLATTFFGSLNTEAIVRDRKGGGRSLRIGRSATDFALALAQQVDQLAAEDEHGSVVGRLATLSRLLQETTRLRVHSPALVNLNDVAARACRRLRGVVGEGLEVLSSLDSTVNPVYLDPDHVELALLHCAMGANHRTRGRGALILEVSNVVVDDAFAADFRGLKRGAHTMLTVSAIAEPPEPNDRRGTVDRDSPSGFGELAEQVCRDVALANDGVFALQSGTFGGPNLQMLFRCAATSIEVERNPVQTGTETILIVDRDERVRQWVADQARRAGYRVLLAEDLDGGRLVFEIHAGKIDVMVLETALHLGEGLVSLPQAPTELVLHTSHYPWNALRAAGVALPRARYLQKPYSIGALLSSVRAMLGEARARSTASGSAS